MISLNTKIEEQAQIKTQYDEFDDVKKVFSGYTERELHMAFDLVCSESHWKEGNRVKLSKTIINNYSDVIEAAVIFFTGGGCEFYYTGEKRKTYWCEFAGYWANGMEG